LKITFFDTVLGNIITRLNHLFSIIHIPNSVDYLVSFTAFNLQIDLGIAMLVGRDSAHLFAAGFHCSFEY